MKLTKQLKGYESDITRLIREIKQKNPKIDEDQRAGRAILWDKPPIDLDSMERVKESRVKQQPYVYQPKN